MLHLFISTTRFSSIVGLLTTEAACGLLWCLATVNLAPRTDNLELLLKAFLLFLGHAVFALLSAVLQCVHVAAVLCEDILVIEVVISLV